MNIEEIKQINIDISEKDGTIKCSIAVPGYSSYFRKRIVLRTQDVQTMLARKGHQIGKVISEASINNKYLRTPWTGTWVFESAVIPPPKPKPAAPKKRATKPRPLKTTNVKK